MNTVATQVEISFFEIKMLWICFMLFGSVISAPTDEFMTILREGEFSRVDEISLKQILPSSHGSSNKAFQLSYLFSKDNEYYRIFNKYVEKGITLKGLTFNIYNDDMRNAAIALFKLMRNTKNDDRSNFVNLMKWAKYNVNSDIFDYAWRLACLFDTSDHDEKFPPPFLMKPNYFIGGETILKAFYISDNIGKISESILKTYQISYIDERNIAINTNYTGWNIPTDTCNKQINYFTEDVALNSYYYGLQLLHPFWMTDQELIEFNPRHAEHYYYAHKQLYARYLLEKEHLESEAIEVESECEAEYNPYLYYENDLPFPQRCAIYGDVIKEDYAYLEMKDIMIKEIIHKGIVEMENGTQLSLNDDNYETLLAKLVRDQIYSIKTAKVTRHVIGYRTSGYNMDKYNPAPSVLHHPQTVLREPIYWHLIKRDLGYFSLYINNTKPYDMSKYERDNIIIKNFERSNVSTNFQYYLINLHKSLEGDKSSPVIPSLPYVFARQRRLNNEPFKLIFTIESKLQQDVTVRLFLGPSCSISDCWDLYYKFFQLDCYRYRLNEGSNVISWTPDTSSRYYSDQRFNKSMSYEKVEDNYDIYRFPKNLIIPKGLEEGLNLTIFVMIDDEEIQNNVLDSSLYMQVTGGISNKSLGFPFHRQVDKETLNKNAPNYRFYNITINHIRSPMDNTVYFSPNIY